MRLSATMETDATVGDKPRAPIVPGLPLLGNALTLFRDPLPMFVRLYQELGPIFRVRVPGQEITVLCGPEATLFLTKHDEDYLSRREIYARAAKELRQEHFIALVDGDAHRHERKILQPGFDGAAITRYIPHMLQAAERVARTWVPGQCLRMKSTMQLLISQQLGFAMAHHKLDKRSTKDAVIFAESLVGAGIAGTWPAFMLRRPAYRSAKRRVVALMHQLIEERRAQGPNEQEPDLLDALLEASDLEGQPLTEIDIIVGLQLPFTAGMDTVAATANYVLYELHKHSEVLEQLVAEIDNAWASGIRDVQAFRQMPTLHSVVKETLRLHPVITAVPRYARKPFVFQGCRVDPGQRLLISTTTAHFLPNLFHDPWRFDIARGGEYRQPGAYAPFTAGPHTCIGNGVSEAVIATTVAALLHTVRLELDPWNYTLTSDINPLPGPKRNFRLRVREQRSLAAAAPPLVKNRAAALSRSE